MLTYIIFEKLKSSYNLKIKLIYRLCSNMQNIRIFILTFEKVPTNLIIIKSTN